MATEYISREAAEKRLNRLERESYHSSVVWPDHVEQCREALREIDLADVVSRDCYDRVLAENDTMREMLAQIGKKPGDKMDDVRPAAEIFDAVDEVLDFLNENSNCMPYHIYSALFDLVSGVCPNFGADIKETGR